MYGEKPTILKTKNMPKISSIGIVSSYTEEKHHFLCSRIYVSKMDFTFKASPLGYHPYTEILQLLSIREFSTW